MTFVFTSYGFEKDNAFIEMVIDKEDETRVYFWGRHRGTMTNGTELSMPVHLAVQFTNGKITAEHIYCDATELNAALTAMAVAKEIEDTIENDISE
jgi:ketosteroid isomerase-like protein